MPNEVAMTYRVNPSSAAISETAFYSFINRDVELSRAGQEDQTNLLSVTSAKINDEKQIEVSASANRAAFLDKNGKPKYSVTNGEGKLPIAALVLWNGQARTVSDYITVAAPQQLNKLTIANIAGVEKDDMVPYEGLAQRTANFPTADGETAAYLAGLTFSGKGAAASIVYTNTTAATGLDLTTVVGLFAEDNNLNDANIGFMEDLGFSGITYKFSKPSKYIGTGDTNQQDFVDLNGSILTVTTDSKLTGTAAIGRTPIIRVDAYMNDNFVASAYMKIKITEDAFTGGDTEVTIPTKSLIYNDLSKTFTTVGALSWQDVNKYFYGDNGLTAESFWKSYDKTNVKVVATALGTDGKPVNVATDGTAGLMVNRNFISENPTGTDAFNVRVNNAIQTQYEKDKNNAGYQDVNGQGAQYTVTITIPALDPLVRGNIVMTQTFYVKEAHTKYTLNPVYNVEGTNMISTNGILGENGVNMSLNLFTAFASADVLDKDGKVVGATEIMNFYNTAAPVNGAFEAKTVANSTNPIANAKSIKFEVITPKDKAAVAEIQADGYTIVPKPQMMEVPSVKTTVRYTITLENGAICPFDFEVEFVNPLKAGTITKGLSINGNATTQTVQANEKVSVVTSGANEAIYNWIAKSGTTPAHLGLTTLGKNSYKLVEDEITVKYVIKNDAAYNSFVGQLVSGKLEWDEETGEITYTKGATIQKGATLTVVATVTFPDLSVVEVNIPLEITTK